VNPNDFGGKFKNQTCSNFHGDYFCRSDAVVSLYTIVANRRQPQLIFVVFIRIQQEWARLMSSGVD
jgi:hypothetical protein